MRAVTLTINPALDTNTTISHVLANRKLRCGEATHEPGGGGINVARVLTTLGSDVTAVFPVGGPTGEILTSLVEATAVRHQPIRIEGWPRENFTVLETSTNQQYQFIMPGPNVSTEEQDRCLDALASFDPPPDYIVASGSLPPGVDDDFYARVVKFGRRIGARVVVDTSGEPLVCAGSEGAYLMKPNLPELESLGGRQLTTEDEQEAGARELLDRGVSEVVLASLGAGGAMLVTREATARLRAPTVRTQSRVGAGDSMIGGVVHGLMRGDSVHDGARLGIAAGAAAVMTPGTQLCRREDIERIYAAISDS